MMINTSELAIELISKEKREVSSNEKLWHFLISRKICKFSNNKDDEVREIDE